MELSGDQTSFSFEKQLVADLFLCALFMTEEHLCSADRLLDNNEIEMLPSEIDEIAEQMPSIVVFSGGTAFNSIAGEIALH